MKALSIRQPWAWLIVNGYKDIENRSWALKGGLPRRVYVHASQTWAILSKDTIVSVAERLYIRVDIAEDWLVNQLRPQCRGALIGEVDIVARVTESDSQWFEGPYGYVLANPVSYETPIPYKGSLGFFEVTLRQRLRAAFGAGTGISGRRSDETLLDRLVACWAGSL